MASVRRDQRGVSTIYRERMLAAGLCPGSSRRVHAHDGSRFRFCFKCRVKQAARAQRWYQENRAYAQARKRQSDAARRGDA
jgi:hypothetical protein